MWRAMCPTWCPYWSGADWWLQPAAVSKPGLQVRPCFMVSPEFSEEASPIKWERLKGTDFVVIRELTGGIYFGDRTEGDAGNPEGKAIDTMVYTVPEIERSADPAKKTTPKNTRTRLSC